MDSTSISTPVDDGGQRRIRREVLRSQARMSRARAGLSRERLETVLDEAGERRMMRERVREMVDDGWTPEELAQVGITPAWLRAIGFFPDREAEPRPSRPAAPAHGRPRADEVRRIIGERQALCEVLRSRAHERGERIHRLERRMEEMRARRERQWMDERVREMLAEGWPPDARAETGTAPEGLPPAGVPVARSRRPLAPPR